MVGEKKKEETEENTKEQVDDDEGMEREKGKEGKQEMEEKEHGGGGEGGDRGGGGRRDRRRGGGGRDGGGEEFSWMETTLKTSCERNGSTKQTSKKPQAATSRVTNQTNSAGGQSAPKGFKCCSTSDVTFRLPGGKSRGRPPDWEKKQHRSKQAGR